MRTPAAAAVLLAALFAGCISEETPSTEPGAPPAQADEDRAALLNETLADDPEFCAEEDTCDFWDLDYHEYIVYNLDTVVFDVVIVPPVGGTTPENIAASRQAVQAWSDGIEALAAPWLAEAFEVNVYAVGIDVPSLDAVEDPDIVVVSASALFLVGIGLEPVQITCQILGRETLESYGGHAHDGNVLNAENCAGTGFTCFALNVGSLAPRGLYDLIAHEVGHCFGGGHVGDALDFRARYAPIEDIMSYQENPGQVHCVSNMNVRTLEGVYAHILDQPEETFLPAGSFNPPMNPLDYMQVECENPAG